jgi:hypothetical protein
MLTAVLLAMPAFVAAQGVPNAHASDTAKSKVAQHRRTHVRGTANRPVTPATPAKPATPSGTGAAATPATPAIPASASKKPVTPVPGRRP